MYHTAYQLAIFLLILPIFENKYKSLGTQYFK